MEISRKYKTVVRAQRPSAFLSRPPRAHPLSVASRSLLLTWACLAAILGSSDARLASAFAEERSADPGCAALQPDRNGPGSPGNSYDRAVKDAADIQPCERLVTLEMIRRDNPDLIWDASGTRVLVVTWTPNENKILEHSSGDSFKTSKETELWVTTVPTVHAMLVREGTNTLLRNKPPTGGRTGFNVVLRTKKYLGLPETSAYDQFVELWVAPKDLLRPCEHDMASDVQCNTTSAQPNNTSMGTKARGIDPNYPFTRLGYTYDWGNEITEVGATEFVIKPESTIEIFRILSNAQYLQCDSPDFAADPEGRILRTCH